MVPGDPLTPGEHALVGAAQQSELWPHAVALAWQAVWVFFILRLGAKLFRRTVLKSGPRAKWWKFSRA